MIIDVHTHLMESVKAYPKKFYDSLYRVWVTREGKEEAERKAAELNGTAEKLIKDMDEGRVDKAVVTPVDFGIMCEQEPEIPIWEQNEYIAESQRKYPDRIIGFVGLDPIRKGAPELLEKAVTDLGLQGVKVFPGTYKVTDDRIQPFWQKVNELELPVLLHQGIDPYPYLMQYGNPLDLDALALKYPKITFNAAHIARGFDNLLTEIIVYRPGRIYTDISAQQPHYSASRWHCIMNLRHVMDRIPSAVMMGSDWPTNPIPEWFDIIRDLKIPEPVLQLGLGIRDFSQEEKELILGENAKHFLGIE